MELFAAYLVATLIILAIPGPTIMLVFSYALTHGRKTVLPASLGVGLGDTTAVTLSLLGMGAVMATSANLFMAVKWAGALYLLYLGIKAWISKPPSLAQDPQKKQSRDIPARKIFFHAFAVTAMNPKSIMFFIAFLPQFVDTQADTAPQLLLLGSTFVVLAIASAAIYGMAAAEVGNRLKSPSLMSVIQKVSGGVLISAAALTLRLQRS